MVGALADSSFREAGRIWYQRHSDLPDWTEELAIRSCELVADYIRPVEGQQFGTVDASRLNRAVALLEQLGQASIDVEPSDIVRFDVVE